MTPRELYLNHAGTSWPKPRVVVEAVRKAMDVAPTDWPQRFDEAHQAIAEFFGVSRPSQLLLTPGCTSALAVGIGDALIPQGKRVLTSRWEHHALHRPLLQLAAKGVRVDYIPPKKGDSQSRLSLVDLDWLHRALSDGDVALIAITAACNVTGELLPIEEVTCMAHDHGAMVLIDAAQVVGWLKLDLPQMGADMVAFGGHKGLQAPWGIGGLYVSDNVPMQCAAATCEVPAKGKDGHEHRRPGYCDVGSVDQFALAGLHAAIQSFSQQNMAANLTCARNQMGRIREVLERTKNVQLFGNSGDGMPSLAFAISGCASDEVASRLRERGLVVGSGIQCAPLAHESLGTQQTGLVRLSVGVGQTDIEIDDVIDRLYLSMSEDFC